MNTARKHSRKRDAILDCMRRTTTHPTAEWIYGQLKTDYPDLSLGTVYRNLAMFKEEGSVVSVGTVGGFERFDARTDAHDHFICTQCRAVLDLEMPELPQELLHSAGAQLDASVTGYRLNYCGLCSQCRKKQNAVSK